MIRSTNVSVSKSRPVKRMPEMTKLKESTTSSWMLSSMGYLQLVVSEWVSSSSNWEQARRLSTETPDPYWFRLHIFLCSLLTARYRSSYYVLDWLKFYQGGSGLPSHETGSQKGRGRRSIDELKKGGSSQGSRIIKPCLCVWGFEICSTHFCVFSSLSLCSPQK